MEELFCFLSEATMTQGTKGYRSGKNIYDINCFQMRFFTKSDLRNISLSNGFEPYKITEAYEEPTSLYCVFTRKKI
jgi:hypothetical protein